MRYEKVMALTPDTRVKLRPRRIECRFKVLSAIGEEPVRPFTLLPVGGKRGGINLHVPKYNRPYWEVDLDLPSPSDVDYLKLANALEFEISSEGFDARLELALRAWGTADTSVRTIIESVDARRLATLRRLLRGIGFEGVHAEARAFLLYSVLFGAALLPESHGRSTRRRALTTYPTIPRA